MRRNGAPGIKAGGPPRHSTPAWDPGALWIVAGQPAWSPAARCPKFAQAEFEQIEVDPTTIAENRVLA